MKKRLLSLALVLVMVFSLMPTSAFALGKTTITKQPVSTTVTAGDTAEFTISAINPEATKPLKYIWYDYNKVDSARVKLTKTLDEFLALFDGATLGTGTKLIISNAREKMDICCVVYWEDTILSKQFATDVEVSNEVTLTVTAACAKHILGVNLTEVPAVEATCAHEGNKTYYKCDICGRCYADADATIVTTADACTLAKLSTHKMPLTHHDAQAATCGESSIAEYWECDECGQLFKDAEGTQTTTLIALKLDGSKDPNNHPADKVTHKEYTEPTCTAKGNYEYWYCAECNTYFKDEKLTEKYAKRSDTEIAKDASKHAQLVEHPYKAATCIDPGNLPYFECTDCGNCYANADGTNQYANKNDVTIKATGHDYKWVEISENGTILHAQQCAKCGMLTSTGAHSGGTASCKDKAICSTCGLPYGELDPNNHINKEVRNAVEATITKPGYSGDIYCADCGTLIETGHETDKLCGHTVAGSGVVVHHDAVEATCEKAANKHQGSIEYWECTECGKLWSDSGLTTEITKADTVVAYQQHFTGVLVNRPNENLEKQCYNVNKHWSVCKFCDEVLEAEENHSMSGATPTCHSGDTCRVCGYDDGQRDPHNHTGGTEVRNAREPNGVIPGYTGDTVCAGCGEVKAAGHYYYAPCSDGCKNLKQVPAVPKTCTEDGTKAYYVCPKCNNYYMDAKATVKATNESIVDPCTGHDLHPTLNLLGDISVSQLLDLLKNVGYSDLVKGILNGTISVDDALKNIHIRDIDHCHDDEYHWLGCQRCGKTLADLKPELEANGVYIKDIWYSIGQKEAHAGGVATCKEKAKCTECGEYYGSLSGHKYGEDNKCTVCGVTIPACAAPTLTVSASSGKVVLKWNAVADASGYEIHRSTDGKSFAKINTVAVTSYTDTSAKVGTKYYYKVRARGTNGSYGAFSELKACNYKCAAPTVKITTSSGHPKISWKAVNGASKYNIYRSTNGTSFTLYTSTTKTSFTNGKTTIGTTYYYKVKAVSASGSTSNFSAVKSIKCRPAAPTLTVSRSAGKPKLSWKTVSGASKYWVYRSTDGKNFKYYVKTTKTSYTDKNTKVGTRYYYKVQAVAVVNKTNVNSASSSAKSLLVSTAAPSVKISTSNGKPKLTWSSVSGATKYWVYRSTDGVNYKYLGAVTKTTFINSGAKKNTKYYYKVKAVKVVNGNNVASGYSNTVSIKSK